MAFRVPSALLIRVMAFMTVDPAAIRVVLEDAPDIKGKGADPKRFYDNTLIQAVNRDYASKLFPGEVK